jgi:RimJ/RimL family protein N-acetyltransferase
MSQDDGPRVPPPYLIRTERLVIRCWEPRDAALLGEALDASLEHLRPWMPWAHDEPTPLDERIDRLRRFRGMFDLGQDFIYGLFTRDESEVVGGSGLHTRVGEGALEIGYWLRSSRVGGGLAREATAAITYVAFRVCEVDRVEIRIDPANERSLGVPRALGFVEEGTLARRLPAGPDGVPRDMVLFTVFRDDFGGLEMSRVKLEAFDALGRRLLV